MKNRSVIFPADPAFDSSRPYGVRVATEKTPTGYRMEGSLRLEDLGVPYRESAKGSKTSPCAGLVFGFDLVNSDLDEPDGPVSQLGWQGSGKNPTDPSGLGTLILQL